MSGGGGGGGGWEPPVGGALDGGETWVPPRPSSGVRPNVAALAQFVKRARATNDRLDTAHAARVEAAAAAHEAERAAAAAAAATAADAAAAAAAPGGRKRAAPEAAAASAGDEAPAEPPRPRVRGRGAVKAPGGAPAR